MAGEGALVRLDASLARDLYAAHGFEAVSAVPEQLSFEGGRLRIGDVAVDLVHRACPTRGASPRGWSPTTWTLIQSPNLWKRR